MVRPIHFISLVALTIGMLFTPSVASFTSAQSTPPPPSETDKAIATALDAALNTNAPKAVGFPVGKLEIDHIDYSQDGHTAIVWLAMHDPTTGLILETEPSPAIARNTGSKTVGAAGWAVSLQSASDWSSQLSALPADLLSDTIKGEFLNGQKDVTTTSTDVYRGYKLPWASSLGKRVTNSIGHYLSVSGGFASCPSTCQFAFDFADGTLFPILAAKGGVTRYSYDGCANNDHGCTNYLVLEDASTIPTTYQVYFHLAYHTLASNVKPAGSLVVQGQYVADADNTGNSTGSHLHYMVTKSIYFYSSNGQSLPWGNSIDIRFDDVSINDGRPRMCTEAAAYPNLGSQCNSGNMMVSGNKGANPPTGALSVPFAWTSLTNRMLDVSGTATDNLQVTRVQVLINTAGTWNSVADADYANGVFGKSLDMCSLNIPNGPFGLAVRIWDREGNRAAEYTGMRQVFKNYSCTANSNPPLPVCQPAATEVAVYADANFQGECKKFAAGTYAASGFGALGDNNVASIQVGTSVHAILYDLASDLSTNRPQGRIETFTSDDASLADNRIGSDTTSGLWVQTATDQQDASVLEPFLTFPGNAIDPNADSAAAPQPANPKSTDSLVLSWYGAKGATNFTANLQKPAGTAYKSMPEQNTNTWSVGTLPAGQYLWTVTAKNGTTTNSTSLTFTVDADTLSTAGEVPSSQATFDMEAGAGSWVKTGLWRWGDVSRLSGNTTAPTKAWIFNNGTNYTDAAVRAGDLTSPPIRIASSGAYYLRFKFYSDIEGAPYAGQIFGEHFWDQRRIQVSVDNGTFIDLASSPLTQDAQNGLFFWPSSPAINLGTFAIGQSVRVRFHFDTIDPYYNTKLGWAVDEVSVSPTAPDLSCAEATKNDTLADATAITVGTPVTGATICPAGDVDYYKFSGAGGQTVKIDITAKRLTPPSGLDTFIDLLDSSGNVLTSNDDAVSGSIQDSQIISTLTRNGSNVYYVRVRAWDHPGAGGPTYNYNLSVTSGTTIAPDAITLTKPSNPARLPIAPFIVEASVQDNAAGGGIKQVDFYWHSADWTNPTWTKFATDTTNADGWWGIFSQTQDTTGSAFYVMATNASGGTKGLLVGGMKPDYNTPYSAMHTLVDHTNSTAVNLVWEASSPLNDIHHFEIQYKFNSGAWQNWSAQPSGTARSAWFVAPSGPGRYDFRMRAVNTAGSMEDYPDTPETSTTLDGACNNTTTDATLATAQNLPQGMAVQAGLCQNAIHWVSFSATPGQNLLILLKSLGGGAALHATLYDGNGAPLNLTGSLNAAAGQPLALRYVVPGAGTYYVSIASSDPAIYGNDVRYSVWVGDGHFSFMPVISH